MEVSRALLATMNHIAIMSHVINHVTIIILLLSFARQCFAKLHKVYMDVYIAHTGY